MTDRSRGAVGQNFWHRNVYGAKFHWIPPCREENAPSGILRCWSFMENKQWMWVQLGGGWSVSVSSSVQIRWLWPGNVVWRRIQLQWKFCTRSVPRVLTQNPKDHYIHVGSNLLNQYKTEWQFPGSHHYWWWDVVSPLQAWVKTAVHGVWCEFLIKQKVQAAALNK